MLFPLGSAVRLVAAASSEKEPFLFPRHNGPVQAAGDDSTLPIQGGRLIDLQRARSLEGKAARIRGR